MSAMEPNDRDNARSANALHRLAFEADYAKRLLRRRREREKVLGAHHFSDPNWDMMLDLFIAQTRGDEIAISSLIVASPVSQSTALRRVRRLVGDGDLLARADPHDGRRTYLRLSHELFERIGRLLSDWASADQAKFAGCGEASTIASAGNDGV